MKKYRCSSKYEMGGMMGGKRKPVRITAGEKRQGKGEYKSMTATPKTGDAEYDKFVAQRAKKRDELAGGTKMRGNSEKMVSKTAKYCGPESCAANPIMSGDGANKPLTRGTQKTVRGGRSYNESGSGNLRKEMRQQRREDISALAAGSRANASEYDIQRADKVRTRLAEQAAEVEKRNRAAYNKANPSSSTMSSNYAVGGVINPKKLQQVAKAPAPGQVKKMVPMGQYEARVVQDVRNMASQTDMKGRPMYPGGMGQVADDYYAYYTQQLDKAKSLDNPDKMGASAALKKQIQRDNSETILYDIPASQLKREAKSIAKKFAKQSKGRAK